MRRSLAVCSLSLLVAVSLTGCTSMFATSRTSLPDAAAAAAGEPAPTVDITLKGKRGKPTQKTLAYTPGMSVQDALAQTSAIRKFPDMEIKVYRVTPYSKGVPVPLQSDYDPAKNRVPILNDMALHPGDKILVEENDNSQMDLLLEKITGGATKRRELR